MRLLPVDSGCGDECKLAIDAASHYLYWAKRAGCVGEIKDALIENVHHTISIFWRG